MRHSERKTLAVIGAGPKGIAVAVKAKVLEEFGLPVDRVILIEKHSVAAHWSGECGYTNGEMKLGTSPEKDVVFPMETKAGDAEINRRIQQRLMDFTWTAFLVQSGRFSDWVDRGRPAPCHMLWACYLKWVSEQLAPQVQILSAEVVSVDIRNDNWNLTLRDGAGGLTELASERLMLTGPGKTKVEFASHNGESLPEGTYDLESFWSAMKAGTFKTSGRLAIVGAGENAASALLTLSKFAPDLHIEVIAPKGFISTRAENFYENQVYSQPERNGWRDLELGDRAEFIARTDLGVFSAHAMQILSEQVRHRIVAGRVVDLEAEAGQLNVSVEYAHKLSTRKYDQVLLATGFDQVAMLKSFFTARALAVIEQRLGARLDHWQLTQRIQYDLSVEGLAPALHLPMLAGLMQGPGFANLSCLGRLSDRIVVGPVSVQSAQRQIALAEAAP